MDFNVEVLINSVCTRPALWDKTIDAYKDRFETAKNWREVCVILNGDFKTLSTLEQKKYEKEIMTKWKTLRDGYRKALDRTKKAKRSGAPASKIKKYVYHDQMDFLRKVFDGRAIDDTLGSDAGDEESSSGCAEGEPEDRQQFTESAGLWNQESSANQGTVTSRRKNGPEQTPQLFIQDMQIPFAESRRQQQPPRETDELVRKILRIIETPNRHISFMQGLMPTLETFTDDEVLQFQAGTISLIQKIKSARISVQSAHPPLAHQQDTYQS